MIDRRLAEPASVREWVACLDCHLAEPVFDQVRAAGFGYQIVGMALIPP